MTYKLLDLCLEAISIRTHNNTVILASIHGIRMELHKKHKPVVEKDLTNARLEVENMFKEKQENHGKQRQ